MGLEECGAELMSLVVVDERDKDQKDFDSDRVEAIPEAVSSRARVRRKHNSWHRAAYAYFSSCESGMWVEVGWRVDFIDVNFEGGGEGSVIHLST